MNLENFAKKFGLPPWAGGLGMIFFALMPLFQQTTEEDGVGKGGSGPAPP